MKFLVLLLVLLTTGCAVMKPTAHVAQPQLTITPIVPKFRFLQPEKPNQFCNPDWVPYEGEEVVPEECKPIIDCNKDTIWKIKKDICPSVI